MKDRQPKLKDYLHDIQQCVKCGTCHAYCPVYDQERREPVVARGKMALAQTLLEGKTEIDERFMRNLSECLLCGSCSNKCPNKVPVEEIVAATRREIAAQKGLSLFGLGLTQVLRRPWLMKLGARFGHLFSAVLFRRIPQQSGLRLRFPAPYIRRDRTIPKVAPHFLRDSYPDFIPGAEDRPHVALFTGCMINFMFPQIGDAAIHLLKALGINIHIPKEQGCCGVPALSAGSGEVVTELAQRNFEALSRTKVDAVLTMCASCNFGLRSHLAKIGGEAGEELAAKVMDIHPFLMKYGIQEILAHAPAPAEVIRVTWHDPCHLRNIGVTAEPRALLKALPGIEFVEMPDADKCCGLGGTFSVYHYDLSLKIGAKKVNSIAATKAAVVATGCPGCMLQLQDSINHAGLNCRVCHSLELLDRALKLEQSE
ncbi:MAG: (Fe-S)-binding protein [Deltaproteobacteria bacterium]|nr:(Fe-S)-binding protein [Deltaproteobacteria bacterium]